MDRKVSILGATGYAGAELMRILYNHPNAEVVHITSERHAGEHITALYPHLRGLYDMELESMRDIARIGADSDFVFIGLPHGHAMEVGRTLAGMRTRIIDLGADYRFDDTDVYEAWYHVRHTHADAPRTYGLSELCRDAVRTAKIIGNAGCFTTASILALAPLAKERLVDVNTILVDAKSGVSGAGRGAKTANHFPELYDNFRAYNVAHHRHTPEIEQEIGKLAGEKATISFTPHLVPMSRGILATCYATLKEGVTEDDVDAAYEKIYRNEHFIRLLGRGAYPSTKEVRGSNFCDIAWHIDARTHRVIALSAIDNLVKGAAGQAVQNFNIACGFDETTGLMMTPLYP